MKKSRDQIKRVKLLFSKDFICSFDREREKSQKGGTAEGEAGTPLSREPDVGPHPRTQGPGPELKADAQLIEPPRRLP